MGHIRMSEMLAPVFYDFAKDVMRHGHTHYDIRGGRGSLKSSTVSLLVPQLLIANPKYLKMELFLDLLFYKKQLYGPIFS